MADPTSADAPAPSPLRTPLLFVTVLIVSTSGLVYELLAGAYSSYVLGDSVRQFSTTIGVYLFAMGIGSYLSRFVKRDVARRFIEVELGAALVGGGSVPLLQLGAGYTDAFALLLYGTIIAIGTLVGLEIPLLMRILKEELEFDELVARVLTFDYIGALFGSILFAILFVPNLGLMRTSLFFGLLNCGVAMMGVSLLSALIPAAARARLRATALLLAVALGVTFAYADRIIDYTEQALYPNPIVHAQQSRYQRIVMTRGARGTQLFLDGNLQFSSNDEYRYHEALVHPAFAAAARHERVLVLGGGDGLAVREILKYPDVREVVLVDLDPAMTRLAREDTFLRELNRDSLTDPRVTVINDDAMVWLDERMRHAPEGTTPTPFDVLIVDFPDPNNFSLGKLYTRSFYRLLQTAMAEDAAVVVQSTSPLYARQSFWCIEATMREAGFSTHAFHATVPSFGEWGYVLARRAPFEPPRAPALPDLRFLDGPTLASLFVFGPDMAAVPVETNRLNNQMLVRYYEREWSRVE
ncbi:MAG: polyamine aminopropyltransferase [Sandaracinaceae bacterium]|nr:polyamine aminopropyltransferase [Myxococcales bacterium]MCB9658578.1 polyamine aminopropyltransferase [Sandaracinaceae bacterium]